MALAAFLNIQWATQCYSYFGLFSWGVITQKEEENTLYVCRGQMVLQLMVLSLWAGTLYHIFLLSKHFNPLRALSWLPLSVATGALPALPVFFSWNTSDILFSCAFSNQQLVFHAVASTSHCGVTRFKSEGLQTALKVSLALHGCGMATVARSVSFGVMWRSHRCWGSCTHLHVQARCGSWCVCPELSLNRFPDWFCSEPGGECCSVDGQDLHFQFS